MGLRTLTLTLTPNPNPNLLRGDVPHVDEAHLVAEQQLLLRGRVRGWG